MKGSSSGQEASHGPDEGSHHYVDIIPSPEAVSHSHTIKICDEALSCLQSLPSSLE
jgi:hypothetical protein